MLAGHSQRLPAGSENVCGLTAAEHAIDEFRATFENVLAIVEHEEHRAVRQAIGHALKRPGRLAFDTGAVRDGPRHISVWWNRRQVDEHGTIGFYLSDGARHSLRQSIPAYYHRNGLCYAVTRAHLVENGRIIDRDAQAVVIDRHVVNIDDLFELELAEWLLNRERDA
jgi:hypothetical protein